MSGHQGLEKYIAKLTIIQKHHKYYIIATTFAELLNLS